jgi:hypothetical protein
MSVKEPGQKSADIASDLAYVRALAEEGRDAPLVGGFSYLLWGGLMGATALLAFLAESNVVTLGGVGIIGIWVVAIMIGWAVSFMAGRREGAMPGALTLGNRTALAVWRAVGVFMTLFWISLMFAHDNFTAIGVPRFFLFSLMFPVAFGLYGVAFYATAVAARLDWLKGFAILSWGFSIASLLLSGSHYQFLLGAMGSLSCAALPGFLLMRQEPKEIV